MTGSGFAWMGKGGSSGITNSASVDCGSHLTWTSVNMNTKLYKHIVRGITPVYQCFVQIEPWIGRGNSPLTKAKNHKSMRFFKDHDEDLQLAVVGQGRLFRA